MMGRVPSTFASSGPVHDLLKDIYTIVLKVFQITARVFTNRKGSIRKTPAIIGDVLWTPFDVRYKEILDELQTKKELLFDEIHLLQAEKASDAEVKAAEERKMAEAERQRANCARQKIDSMSASSAATLAILQRQAKGQIPYHRRFTYSTDTFR